MTLVSIGLTAFGRNITLSLPEADHITRIIDKLQDFYERPMLDDLLRRTEPGQTVVDVGAHVGNHSVFLAGVGDLNVIAFEPNPSTFSILEDNIRQNGLVGRITAHRAAAGSSVGAATLNVGIEDNTGTASVDFGEGDIAVTTVDAATAGQTVACMKIDVEGAELEVLQGSTRVLVEDRPALYIEVQDILQERLVHPFLKGHGYRFAREFNATPTQLFLHTESEYSALYPPSLSDLPIEHTRAVVNLSRMVESVAHNLESSVRAFEDFSRNTIQSSGGAYRLLHSYTEEVRKLTALFSELYKRTKAAGQSNADILAILKDIEARLQALEAGSLDLPSAET